MVQFNLLLLEAFTYLIYNEPVHLLIPESQKYYARDKEIERRRFTK